MASKRARSTSREPRLSDSSASSTPVPWNRGGPRMVVSPARIGSRASTEPGRTSDLGSGRGAPLGVPVVPLVSSTIRPGRVGAGGSRGSPVRTIASSVSSPGAPVVAMAPRAGSIRAA